jgi:ribonuclease-3
LTDPRLDLVRLLGYQFRDESLLRAALTHRSAGSANNERLEFLGDGLLNCVIGEALYQLRPLGSEGDLTRLRASLVRESTLAEIAQSLQLGDCLHVGAGELRTGGYRRQSIVADALEALIGAVYVDSGFMAAREVVLRLYADRLAGLPSAESLKDPKTRLQEHLQARGLPLPLYEVLEIAGQAHLQTFRVCCRLLSPAATAEGQGNSRRAAEQNAAAALLEQLNQV